MHTTKKKYSNNLNTFFRCNRLNTFFTGQKKRSDNVFTNNELEWLTIRWNWHVYMDLFVNHPKCYYFFLCVCAQFFPQNWKYMANNCMCFDLKPARKRFCYFMSADIRINSINSGKFALVPIVGQVFFLILCCRYFVRSHCLIQTINRFRLPNFSNFVIAMCSNS